MPAMQCVRRSEGILQDLSVFLARPPALAMLIEPADPDVRDDHVQRIRQWLGISVADYGVLACVRHTAALGESLDGWTARERKRQ